MDQNPYAVEASAYLAPQELTDVESIRKRCLGHEASVKSMGTLYLIGGVFSAIGLLGFPIGTLISAYFLYLLLSEKGSYVFSDAYKQVIAQTPHMRYKTSILTWIVVILLVTLVLLVIVIVSLMTRVSGRGSW